MTMHHTKIVGNKIDLPQTKTEFIFPKPATDEIPELSFKEQSDLHNQQNKLTLELLEKAIVHVRKYDSLETARQITAKAFHKCPSMFNKRLIVEANRSLKAAIKADKWASIKRRKRHVDQSTVRRNIDTFYEKVAEAVAAIKLDLDKRSLRLFTKIKNQYESTLPLHLPADKNLVKKRAHIVAMCEATPNTKYKVTRLEAQLFLLEDVIVLGVNRNNYVKKTTTLMKAREVAAKLGKTVYERVISRPSDNIDWYLIQDFGTEVKFASFADKMDISDDPILGDSLSYEGFIKKQAEEQRAAQSLKTKRLQNIRQSFYEDNIALFDDVKKLKIELDNLLSERQEIGADFHGLTNVTGEHSGIEVNQIRRLYAKSMEYRQLLQQEGREFAEAHRLSFKQRIEAKARYYDYLDASQRIREVRGRITFLEAELEARKNNYAKKLGMVSTTKYAELDR